MSPTLRPFDMAVFNRDKEMMGWLVYPGFGSNDLEKSDATPLHLAAKTGYAKISEKLIKQGGVEQCQVKINGYTPLHLASMGGQFTNRYGKDWSLTDLNYVKKPRFVINDFENQYESTILVLLKAGADVNARDDRGCTPLHYATRQSNAELVKVLLKAGANVNDVNSEGLSPLRSLRKYNVQGLQYLLAFGADINDIQDSRCNILKNYSSTSGIVLEHLSKLQQVDLPINDTLKSFLCQNVNKRKFDSSDYRIDLDYWNERRKMRKMKLAPGVSLYQWLHVNPKRQFALIDSLPAKVEDEFQHYGTIIQGVRYQAIHRKKFLLEPARKAYHSLTAGQWPHVCVEHILSFLDNRALQKLIDSAANFEC